MRPSVLRFATLAAAACVVAGWAATAAAAGLRVIASDATGVTLAYTPEPWALSAPGRDGRLRVIGVPAAHSLAAPGRAVLPAYSALLALPVDARAAVRVLATGGEDVRDGVRLAIAGRPVFRGHPGDALGVQPDEEDVPAITDGAWPTSPVQMSAPFPFRGRRLVALELRPFRYDAGASRLWAARTLTLRVDFQRPAGAAAPPPGGPDPHADAALATAVMNWDQAKLWRGAPRRLERRGPGLFGARATGAAAAFGFDEDQPEVRVQLDSTGLFLLPYDQLAAKGYPANVPVAQVSVHRHEFLEGQNPPYGTLELPCEVDDANGDGVFDSGDGIWVYVQSWAARSGASQPQRIWGDGEVVYATVKPAGGLRVATRPGWRSAVSPAQPASYPALAHNEWNFARMQVAVTLPQDTTIDLFSWNEIVTYYPRPDTIHFDANDLDTTHAAQVTVDWVGRAANDHYLWAAVKNAAGQVTTVVDSVHWYGIYPFAAGATIPGSALSEGRTNSFRQWGKLLNAPPDPVTNALANVGLDWFEVTYWRRFHAIRDLLAFNSADGTGEVQLHATGFSTANLRLYDVTDPLNPVRVLVDPAHVTAGATVAFDVQDSVATGAPHAYVAACVQTPPTPGLGPREPPASAYAAVTRRQLYANTSGDYLIVVPEAFLPAVAPLVALRQSQGFSVLVAPLESVNDEFNGGRHSAFAIQRFVRFAYQQWSTRFLLLVGDGCMDPQHFSPTSGVDWVPTLDIPGPVPSTGYEVVPSDPLYGIVTGNTDPQGGFTPVLPDLMVGRLPVNSLAEAQGVVAKLLDYENWTGTDPAWRSRAVLLADDAFSGETTFGGGGPSSTSYCFKDIEQRFVGLDSTENRIVLHDAGLSQMQINVFNERYYLTNQATQIVAGDTCRLDRDATIRYTRAFVTPILISALNQGVLWWEFQGHANENVLTHESIWLNSGNGTDDDKNSLVNDHMPFFFTAFSCHANMFARPEQQFNSQGPSIGEDLVNLPNGGAIASWASVGFEVVPRPDSSHVSLELVRSMFAEPPSDEFLGPQDRGARVVLGEVILAALLRYVPTAQTFSLERGIALTYTLLGDPATRMTIGRPENIVTANALPVSDGQDVRLHTPGDTLQLVADLVSTVRLDSLALFQNTGAGDVPVSGYSVTPAFPDTAGGGVYGGRRFRIVERTPLLAQSYDYVLTTKDRYGFAARFTVPFALDGVLRVDATPIADNDPVAPAANLSMQFLCPRPVDPVTDLAMTVNGQPQAFTPTAAPGDTSGREWLLAWTHSPYPIDDYVVRVTVRNGGLVTRRFRVTATSGKLAFQNLFAFPNPFDNSGTYFSFQLLGGENADVKLRVFTETGHPIYSTVVRGLAPGYHQLPWDGRDAEGSEIANGIYFYRLSAVAAGGAHAEQLGRLVKLRKPRHVVDSSTP